jgi:putative PIN family toxin of toxin-antitoxin system
VTPRVVLDTNVIVSGIGWGEAPAAILDAVGDGQLVLVTSASLLAELRRVLEYPKLAKVIRGGAQLADLVAASGVVVAPTRTLTVVSDDDDNRVLEAVVVGLICEGWLPQDLCSSPGSQSKIGRHPLGETAGCP